MEDFKESDYTLENLSLTEHSELSERIGKLNVALCNDGFREKVGDYQFKLMKEQALGMEKYYLALTARLHLCCKIWQNKKGSAHAFPLLLSQLTILKPIN